MLSLGGGGGGNVMRNEHLIYIFYTSTGNAHACGFKAQEEASDAVPHVIVRLLPRDESVSQITVKRARSKWFHTHQTPNC